MSLDQVENFVRVSVDGTHDSGASTVSLESGEASELPPVTDGKYNLVWFDALGFAQPDADPNVEIVRVNSINTNNDTISVTRGVENTSATAKNNSTEYELLLAQTAKLIKDIDANKLDTTQRYTDGEAVSAIAGEVIEPEQSIHSRTIESNLTLSSDDSLILIGPVTGTGSISGNGKFLIPNKKTSSTTELIDANTLDGINASGFVQTNDPIDADTLNGKNASEFVQTGESIDADTLGGINESGFVQTNDLIDADKLDGIDSSGFVQTTDSIDADKLDGIDSSGFVQTNDPIDADTLDGKDSTDFVQSTSGIIPHGSFSSLSDVPSTSIGDVFHVDSKGLFVETDDSTPSDTPTPLDIHKNNSQIHQPIPDPSPLSSHLSSTQFSAESGKNVNIFEVIDISSSIITKNSSNQITFDVSGTFEVSWMVNFHRTGSGSRNIMYSEVEKNGSRLSDRTRVADYIRTNGSGDECSTGSTVILEIQSGDTLRIFASEERGGQSGNDIERAFMNIKRLR